MQTTPVPEAQRIPEAPPSPLAFPSVALLEHAALNAVPAPRVAWDGPFVIRAFAGGTGRANAACSLDPAGDAALEARVARIEAHYARLGLPCRFRSTPLDPPDLLPLLARRGYREADGALVMTAALPPTGDEAVQAQAHWQAHWHECPAPEWLSVLATAEYQGTARRAEKERTPALLARPATWLVLREGGVAAACGHAVADSRLCGLFDLAVRPEFQRRGLGRRLLGTLAGWGAAQGATTCWLQVGPGNTAARRVYEAAGFTEIYRYRYFVRD